ncbi:MAG: hypothetical protein R3E87_13820 [Burkholderiaceae bacterium]
MTEAPASTTHLTDQDSLRKVTILDYSLHIASPIVSMMVLSVIALIINYIKVGESRGTVYESHMSYMISTFWWTALWMLLTGVVAVITFGILAWLMIVPVIWYLYRNVRGLLRALDGLPAR